MADAAVRHIVALLGCEGTGKSAISVQWIESQFIDEWHPTVEDIYRKQLKVDDIHCRIEIWDTSSDFNILGVQAEKYRSMGTCVLVYGINSRKSFDKLAAYYLFAQGLSAARKIMFSLIGNKIDLENERQVSTEEGEELAEAMGASFIESSAKTRHNMEKILSDLIKRERTLNPVPIPLEPKKKCYLM